MGFWRLVVFACVLPFAFGSDCIFELGEWAFEFCSKEVDEARQKRPNLERGICEVVQDQIEKFMAWKGAQLAHVSCACVFFVSSCFVRIWTFLWKETFARGSRLLRT